MQLTDNQVKSIAEEYHAWDGLLAYAFTEDYKDGYQDGIRDALRYLGYSLEEIAKIEKYTWS